MVVQPVVPQTLLTPNAARRRRFQARQPDGEFDGDRGAVQRLTGKRGNVRNVKTRAHLEAMVGSKLLHQAAILPVPTIASGVLMRVRLRW